MVSNGFWHIVSIVKEQNLPVQQKGIRTTWRVSQERAVLSTESRRDFHRLANLHCWEMLLLSVLLLNGKMRFWELRVARLAKKLTPRISTTKQLSQRLQNAIQRSGLIREGDRVGVAVSGGADSVGLLLLLFAGKKKSASL